jgi:hypothetical protein
MFQGALSVTGCDSLKGSAAPDLRLSAPAHPYIFNDYEPILSVERCVKICKFIALWFFIVRESSLVDGISKDVGPAGVFLMGCRRIQCLAVLSRGQYFLDGVGPVTLVNRERAAGHAVPELILSGIIQCHLPIHFRKKSCAFE